MIAAVVMAAMRVVLHSRERHVYFRSRFIDAASSLMEEDCLNEGHLLLIRELVRNIDGHGHAFSVVMSRIDRTQPAENSQDSRSVRMPSEVRTEWARLLYFWLMGISYLKPLRGILLRAKLARMLEPSREAVSSNATTFTDPMEKLVAA